MNLPGWFVYGLRCNDGKLYIGSTNVLERRLGEHARGETLSLKGRLPFTVEFYIAVATEKVARQLEKYLKTGSGRAVIKKRFLPDEATTSEASA